MCPCSHQLSRVRFRQAALALHPDTAAAAVAATATATGNTFVSRRLGERNRVDLSGRWRFGEGVNGRRCMYINTCPGGIVGPNMILISLVNNALVHFDFTVDEGGSAEPTRDKNIIGMYRRGGSSPALLCDPGWVV